LVTTEKDWVRLEPLLTGSGNREALDAWTEISRGAALWVLRVRMELLDGADEAVNARLAGLCVR
jgi:hypothetical protein